MSPPLADVLRAVFPDTPARRAAAARPTWRLALAFGVRLPMIAVLLALQALRGRRRAWRACVETARRGGHLYVALSLQQARALQAVWRQDPDAVVVRKRSRSGAPFLSRPLALTFALRALPALPGLFRAAAPELRAVLALELGAACTALGYAAAFDALLARIAPRAIVLCSDTVVSGRAVLAAARRAGIPTVFLQHGCLTPASPPVVADYALLDGEHTRSVCRIEQPARTCVSLVGLARLCGGLPRPAHRARRRIAVCTGHLASLRVVLETLAAVAAGAPDAEVIVRLHPRQHRRWRVRRRFRGWTLSDAVAQPAVAFLPSVDAVVSGSSSILLEAALLGAAPLLYRPLDAQSSRSPRLEVAFDRARVDPADYYGFVANGLCPTAATPGELRDWLHRTPPPRVEALRHYCDTLGGPYDGRSDELALECIRRAARREPLPLRWDSAAAAPAARAAG